MDRMVMECGFGPVTLLSCATDDCVEPEALLGMVRWLNANGALPYVHVLSIDIMLTKFGVSLDPHIDALLDAIGVGKLVDPGGMGRSDGETTATQIDVTLARSGYPYPRAVQLCKRMSVPFSRSCTVREFIKHADASLADEAIAVSGLKKSPLSAISCRNVFDRLVIERTFPVTSPCALLPYCVEDDETFAHIFHLMDAIEYQAHGSVEDNICDAVHKLIESGGTDVRATLRRLKGYRPKWLDPETITGRYLFKSLLSLRLYDDAERLVCDRPSPLTDTTWRHLLRVAMDDSTLRTLEIIMGVRPEGSIVAIELTPLTAEMYECAMRYPQHIHIASYFSVEVGDLSSHLLLAITDDLFDDRFDAARDKIAWWMNRYSGQIPNRHLVIVYEQLFRWVNPFKRAYVLDGLLEAIIARNQRDGQWLIPISMGIDPIGLQWIEQKQPGGRFPPQAAQWLLLSIQRNPQCIRWLVVRGYLPMLMREIVFVEPSEERRNWESYGAVELPRSEMKVPSSKKLCAVYDPEGGGFVLREEIVPFQFGWESDLHFEVEQTLEPEQTSPLVSLSNDKVASALVNCWRSTYTEAFGPEEGGASFVLNLLQRKQWRWMPQRKCDETCLDGLWMNN